MRVATGTAAASVTLYKMSKKGMAKYIRRLVGSFFVIDLSVTYSAAIHDD
jgi:hypothetical protein